MTVGVRVRVLLLIVLIVPVKRLRMIGRLRIVQVPVRRVLRPRPATSANDAVCDASYQQEGNKNHQYDERRQAVLELDNNDTLIRDCTQ